MILGQNKQIQQGKDYYDPAQLSRKVNNLLLKLLKSISKVSTICPVKLLPSQAFSELNG